MKNENKFFLVVTVNKMLFKICGIFDKISSSEVVNKLGSATEPNLGRHDCVSVVVVVVVCCVFRPAFGCLQHPKAV